MEMEDGSIFILDCNTEHLLTAHFGSITLDQLAFFSLLPLSLAMLTSDKWPSLFDGSALKPGACKLKALRQSPAISSQQQIDGGRIQSKGLSK